jgi:hypothetical protein
MPERRRRVVEVNNYDEKNTSLVLNSGGENDVPYHRVIDFLATHPDPVMQQFLFSSYTPEEIDNYHTIMNEHIEYDNVREENNDYDGYGLKQRNTQRYKDEDEHLTIVWKDCLFLNNSVSPNNPIFSGAIYITKDYHNITFTGCTWQNNSFNNDEDSAVSYEDDLYPSLNSMILESFRTKKANYSCS